MIIQHPTHHFPDNTQIESITFKHWPDITGQEHWAHIEIQKRMKQEKSDYILQCLNKLEGVHDVEFFRNNEFDVGIFPPADPKEVLKNVLRFFEEQKIINATEVREAYGSFGLQPPVRMPTSGERAK
jgi:hypothetical protein